MAAAEEDPVNAYVNKVIAAVTEAFAPGNNGRNQQQAYEEWSQLCSLACSSQPESAQVFSIAFTGCSDLLSNEASGCCAVVLRMLMQLSRTAHQRGATAAHWWRLAVYNNKPMLWIPGLLQILQGTSHSCRLEAAELFQELVRYNDCFAAAWATDSGLLGQVLHLVATGLCHCKQGGRRHQAACMLQRALHHSLARGKAGSAVLSCILQHVKPRSHSTAQEAAFILGLLVVEESQLGDQVRARQLVLSSAGTVMEAFQAHVQDRSLPTAIAASIAYLLHALKDHAMARTAVGLAACPAILQQLLCWASGPQYVSMDAVSHSPALQDEDRRNRSMVSQLAATTVLACLKSPQLLSCICSNSQHLSSMGAVLTNITDPRAALVGLADLMDDKSAWPALADAPGMAALFSSWLSTRLRYAVELSMASRSAESGPDSASSTDNASSSVLSEGTSAAAVAAAAEALQDTSTAHAPHSPQHQPPLAGNASEASRLVDAAGQDVLFGPAQAAAGLLLAMGPAQQLQQLSAAQAGRRAHPSWLQRSVELQEQQLRSEQEKLQRMQNQPQQQPAAIHASWLAKALDIQGQRVASAQQQLQRTQQQLQELQEQQALAAHNLQEEPAPSTARSSSKVGNAVSNAEALAQQPAAQQPEANAWHDAGADPVHRTAGALQEAAAPTAGPTASLARTGGATGSGASHGTDQPDGDHAHNQEPVVGGCPSGSQAGGLSPSLSDSEVSGDLLEHLGRQHNLGLAASSLHGRAIQLLVNLFPFFSRPVQQQLAADAGILQRLEGMLVDRNKLFHTADKNNWQPAVDLLEMLLQADMQAVLSNASTSPVLWLLRLMDYLSQSPGLAEYVDPTSCLRTLARSHIAAADIGSRRDVLQVLEGLAGTLLAEKLKLPDFREALDKSDDHSLPCWKALPQILRQLLKTAPELGKQLQRECWKALCEQLNLEMASALAPSGVPSSAAEGAAEPEPAAALPVPAAGEPRLALASSSAAPSAAAAAVLFPAAEAARGPGAAAAALKATTPALDKPPAEQAAAAAAAGKGAGSHGRPSLTMQSGNVVQKAAEPRPVTATHPAGHLRFKARQHAGGLNTQHRGKPGELSWAHQQSSLKPGLQAMASAAGNPCSSNTGNSSKAAVFKPGGLPLQPAAAAGASRLAKPIGNVGSASSSRELEAAAAAAQQAELGALKACKKQQQELADQEQQAAPSPDALKAHGHDSRALSYCADTTESARAKSRMPAVQQAVLNAIQQVNKAKPKAKAPGKILLGSLQPHAGPVYSKLDDIKSAPADVKPVLKSNRVTASCSVWGQVWAYGQGSTLAEAEEQAAINTVAMMSVCGIRFQGMQPCNSRPE